jgi:hypothetical protein
MVFAVGALAVTLATQVVVPVVLRFLAVFFARDGLTRAAEAVREAGHSALEDIQRSQQWFLRQVHDEGERARDEPPVPASSIAGASGGAPGVRVADEPAPPKSRVASMDDVADEDGEHEARDLRRG